jgi:undecaprenyl-diphosphatase
MIQRLPSVASRIIRRVDLAVLIASSALLVAIYIFAETVDEVTEGETDVVDRRIVTWVKSLNSPDWFDEIMRDCTAFGGIFVLTLTTLAIIFYFLAKRLYHAAGFLALTVGGAFVISMTLKWFFNRPRPDIIPHGSYVMTTSFPSGHAMLSAVVYLTLGSLLARLVPTRVVKVYFIGVAMLLTLLIGVSRVYMGVHYPTDVLAGWTGGLIWALIVWLVARSLQRSGTVEKDTEGADGRAAFEVLDPKP